MQTAIVVEKTNNLCIFLYLLELIEPKHAQSLYSNTRSTFML